MSRVIPKGKYTLYKSPKETQGSSNREGEKEEEKDKDNRSTEFSKSAQEAKNSSGGGEGTFMDVTSGRRVITRVSEYKGKKPPKISSRKIDWDSAVNSALSNNGSSLSERAKKMIKNLEDSKSLVDWKSELGKFFDSVFDKREWSLPSRRHIAGGRYLYGLKKKDPSQKLKTIVAAIDTSASISQEQGKTFLIEVMYLCKKFNADQVLIIYCSDNIDNKEFVKKGNNPDFTLWKSTGGNRDGFTPPFQLVEEFKIEPTVFIYLTDTEADMPDPNKHGINRYKDRVIWFVCSPEVYRTPPFGKVLFAPVSAIKPTK
jgi:predicted metal-dependent peptidase